MKAPLISVLMTSYNTGKFIADAIRSLLDQTYQNWELLLADDCSTDNTREVISEFSDPRIRIFHNTENLHYLRTRNRLTPFINGAFVALLDSDDLYTPDKLQKQIEEFDRDAELVMCGTWVRFISKDGRPLPTLDYKPGDYETIKKEIKTKNVFTGSTIMVKASIWKEFGGYRDFFNTLGYEDYDLTSRIVEKYKAINIQQQLYLYRQYPESTSRRNMLYNPFKLNGHLLIQHFMKQREIHGRDSLDMNDIPAIINFVVERNKPYVDDASLIHREVMWAYLHRKMYLMALTHILKALMLRPFNYKNYKAFALLLLISLGLIKN